MSNTAFQEPDSLRWLVSALGLPEPVESSPHLAALPLLIPPNQTVDFLCFEVFLPAVILQQVQLLKSNEKSGL